MRKLSACVIFITVMMLCVSASADIVYTTSSGDMGLILASAESTDISSTKYSGSMSDTLLGSYWDGGNSRIILVNRTTDTTTSGDTALIFANNNLSAPIISEPRVLAGVYNAQSLAGSYNGRGLFFASGVSIYEFSTDTFSFKRSYTYPVNASEDITPQITALLSGTSNVYAIVEGDISGDVVLAFDGQLREDAKDSFNKYVAPSGTNAIAWLNNSSIVIGHDSGVSSLKSSSFVSLVSSDAPVKALCMDEKTGFYFAEQSESGSEYTTTLKHYSSVNNITTLCTETGGSECRLLYDTNNGLLAALIGSKILIYRMKNDVLIDEYDSASLGGQPVNITMSYVNGDDGRTSSGCDIAGAGIIMFLAGVMIIRRR